MATKTQQSSFVQLGFAILFAIMLASTSSASSSSSSSSSSSITSIWLAALVGAVAVAGVAWRQRKELLERSNGKQGGRRRSSSGSSPGGNSDEQSFDTISQEGSVMVTLPTWAIANSETYFSRRYHTDHEMMGLAVHLSDRNIAEGTGGPFGAAIFERHHSSKVDGNSGGGYSYCTLVSIGMNRVVPLGNSTLHGEMVAMQLAQRRVGSFTLMLDKGGIGNGSEHSDGLFYEDSDSDNDDDGTASASEKDGSNTAKNGTSSTSSADTTTKDADATGESKLPNNTNKRQFELFTSCEPCAMCLGATLWSGVSRIVCGATKADAQAIGFDEGPVFEQSYEHLERCGVRVARNVLREEAAGVLRRYGGSGLIYNR